MFCRLNIVNTSVSTEFQQQCQLSTGTSRNRLWKTQNPISNGNAIAHSIKNVNAFSSFIGIILTATSVSITVETLREMGKLSTPVGNTILGAALIDDILGIIALTLITSFADSSVNIGIVLGKVVLFFVFAGVVGFVFYHLFGRWTMCTDEDRRRYVIVSFAFLDLGCSQVV